MKRHQGSRRAPSAPAGARPGTAAQLRRVSDFFAQHPIPAAERAIVTAQEKIRIAMKRVATEGPQLHAWLARQYPADAVALRASKSSRPRA